MAFEKVKQAGINVLGWRTNRKIVVFESDDWGCERIGQYEGVKDLEKKGIKPNVYLRTDHLETNEDLEQLFDCLLQFKDANGNHPLITANFIVANPDYEKIAGSSFDNYHYKIVTEGLSADPHRDKVLQYWKTGYAQKLFWPQFHGREHVDVKRWMHLLKTNDPIAHAGVQCQTFIGTPNGIQRDGLNATFDLADLSDVSGQASQIEDGLFIFKDIFGFTPKSFIAPAYTWHRSLEPHLQKHGIQYIQTLVQQTEPNPGHRATYGHVFHYCGQKNKYGQYYLLRNSFFEPTINPGTDWVNYCLDRLKIAFLMKKPAIVGTHRINFMGFRSKMNRDQNLALFSVLLKKIIQTWPDVEFMSSDQLGDLIAGKSNA